jgi:hypothetical protein
MSREQRITKFLDCASAAATPMPKDKALAIVETVERLETLPDIGDLMELLA